MTSPAGLIRLPILRLVLRPNPPRLITVINAVALVLVEGI